MVYQIFKQRCNLAASRLLILTSNKQVASKLNQMPVKESNGATCAWYTMAMVQDTKNYFLYTNVDRCLEIMASTSKNLTTHETCIILGSDFFAHLLFGFCFALFLLKLFFFCFFPIRVFFHRH